MHLKIETTSSMATHISYRNGTKDDIPVLRNLLNSNQLPVADITQAKVAFVVATLHEEIIACIGLEKAGVHGLLRSFAVKDGHKNKGIGDQLFRMLLVECRNSGIETLHLLTTTAPVYFEKRGFQSGNRDTAPHEIKQTTEFATICPLSAIYMHLHLP